jgi:hypothetical protein
MMRIIINRSENVLYSQAEVDAAVEKARHGVTGHELRDAWKRYEDLFGVPPHGTEKQLNSLLLLVRARRKP